MASTISCDLLEDLVTCPVCLEFYVNPQILPCQHVLCAKCVDNINSKSGNTLTCTECRDDCSIHQVKKDFNKQKVLDTLRQQNLVLEKSISKETKDFKWKCESCQLQKSKCTIFYFCKECDKFMCIQCQKVHESFPALQNHSLENVDRIIDSRKRKTTEMSQQLQARVSTVKQLMSKRLKEKDEAETKRKCTLEEAEKQTSDMKAVIDAYHNQCVSQINASFDQVSSSNNFSTDTFTKLIKSCEDEVEKLNSHNFQGSDLREFLEKTAISVNSEQKLYNINKFIADQITVSHCSKGPIPDTFISDKLKKLQETFLLVKRFFQSMPSSVNDPQEMIEIDKERYQQITKTARELSISNKLQQKQTETTDPSNTKKSTDLLKRQTKKILEKTTSKSNSDASTSTKKEKNLMNLISPNKFFVKTREVDLSYWPLRIHLVNEQLWCTSEIGLHIYDQNGDKIKSVIFKEADSVHAVILSHKSSLIIACEDSLKEFDNNGYFMSELAAGKFIDVVTSDCKLFALEHKQKRIYIFNYSSGWKLVTRFETSYCYSFDTLAANATNVYLNSWGRKRITKYNHNGITLDTFKYENYQGCKMCEIDNSGNTLLASFFDYKLFVVDSQNNLHNIQIKDSIDSPTDAVECNNGNVIWAITRSKDVHSLIRLG